jgi:hypothetical protein
MTYRVQFFDTDGKLVCWYSSPDKSKAYRYAENAPSSIKVEIDHA